MPRITRARAATALASVASVALLLTGCAGADEPASTVASDCTPKDEGLTTFTPGTLTVGVPENLPYTQTEGADASGLEIDVVRKLADAECLALEFVPITYANGIPMISEQHKTDMITGGWYVTPARAEKVGFTSPTFFDSMGIISKDGIDTVTGLESVGAVGSGAGFSWEADMSSILGDNFKTYPGTAEMKQDLLNGRIQAALDGYAVATVAYEDTGFVVEPVKEDDRVAITTEQPMIAFPIDKDNKALSDAFSTLIDDFRADGTLAELNAAYGLPDSLIVPADKAETSIR